MARTTQTVEAMTNTIVSIEIYPPVYPTNVIMSVILRDCNVTRKSDRLFELFSLKLVEANYKPDPQLKGIRDMLVDKKPQFSERVRAMGGYIGQYVNDFQVKGGYLWMDERLAIPIPLQRPIISRIYSFHHGKANMFDAATIIWVAYIHRSMASVAEECVECTAAGKNLRLL